MREIFADRFYSVSLGDDGVVRLIRTPERIERLADMQASLDELSIVLRAAVADETPRGILMDFRAVLPRNDDDFESMMSAYRRELAAAFGRIAVLTQTQVGKLQMARLDRRDGTETATFEDEAEAMTYLLDE